MLLEKRYLALLVVFVGTVCGKMVTNKETLGVKNLPESSQECKFRDKDDVNDLNSVSMKQSKPFKSVGYVVGNATCVTGLAETFVINVSSRE